MKKRIVIASAVVALLGLLGIGCDEWLVGAPCVPETDKGDYQVGLEGTSWGIETRNVQCQGSTPMMCVTATTGDPGRAREGNENLSDYEQQLDAQGEPVQEKYSFCSCRCKDQDGNKYDKNSDKYDDLCECPPSTVCTMILGNNIDEAPVKIRGSYCIPKCIVEKCTGEGEECTPSTNSEEPWKWRCRLPAPTE